MKYTQKTLAQIKINYMIPLRRKYTAYTNLLIVKLYYRTLGRQSNQSYSTFEKYKTLDWFSFISPDKINGSWCFPFIVHERECIQRLVNRNWLSVHRIQPKHGIQVNVIVFNFSLGIWARGIRFVWKIFSYLKHWISDTVPLLFEKKLGPYTFK